MAVLAPENVISVNINQIRIDDVFKIETIQKPLSFAETFLLKTLLKRWQIFVHNRRLLKQYFNKWIDHHKMATDVQNESTEQKIDLLISELHRMKVKRKKYRSNSEPKPAKRKETTLASECFKHRFKTQKEIIDLQKAKLEEQSRMIEDLKLGIIRDELSKSLESTKSELREIFSKSSTQVKCKMAPNGIKLEGSLASLIVNSSKAPKFLQQMERRAVERARNREIILERKRIIDEEKKRALEEAIEQKKAQDEEEKRRNLEMIREKQRAELERQKIIQMNKEKYLADLKKSNRFYRIKILKRCFGGLQCNVYISKNNELRAESLYEKHLKRNCFGCWKRFINEKYREQYEKADILFRRRVLKQSLQSWKDVRNLFVLLNF